MSTGGRGGAKAKAGRSGRRLRHCVLAAAAACSFFSALPSATFGLETLVVSIAKLRYDNSSGRDNGALKVRALVDDNSTLGQLQVGLLAGTVAVTVSDGAQFAVTLPLTGCELKPSQGIICRSLDRSVRALFLPTAQGPFIYNMRVSARRLPDTATGPAQPVGPVDVELQQPGAVRTDAISDCGPVGIFKLVCREP